MEGFKPRCNPGPSQGGLLNVSDSLSDQKLTGASTLRQSRGLTDRNMPSPRARGSHSQRIILKHSTTSIYTAYIFNTHSFIT